MTGLGSRATLTKPQYLAFWDFSLTILYIGLNVKIFESLKIYFTTKCVVILEGLYCHYEGRMSAQAKGTLK